MASKRDIQEQQKFIRQNVPNPKQESVVYASISHEEYKAAKLRSVTGSGSDLKGQFWMKSGKDGTFTNEVDIEKTYTILKTQDIIDEEEAKARRKEKKKEERAERRAEQREESGCCGAWYCSPFRCSWNFFCSFLGGSRTEQKEESGCCGAWYCSPFRCSWNLFCSFLG